MQQLFAPFFLLKTVLLSLSALPKKNQNNFDSGKNQMQCLQDFIHCLQSPLNLQTAYLFLLDDDPYISKNRPLQVGVPHRNPEHFGIYC